MVDTVTETDGRSELTATSAGQTVFNTDFLLETGETVAVYHIAVSDGAVTVLVLDTDYALSGLNDNNGFTITLLGGGALPSGAAIGDKIVASRNLAIKRATKFNAGGDFSSAQINDELNNLVQMMQDAGREIDRSMRLPESLIYAGSLELPSPVAGRPFGWNATGDGLANMETVGTWRGDWVTATDYNALDLVKVPSQGDNLYVCLIAHTSGTFATDLSAGKWELYVDVADINAAATAAAASEAAAAASASAAATSAANAATSATNAATSETNAGSSATAAGISATNASNSEGNAASSATAAASSATTAGSQATAAATSATNAASSATAAQTAQTAAEAAQTAAETAVTDALAIYGSIAAVQAAQAAAEAAQTAAETAATNAGTSATNASGSATAAANSATSAATQASNAATSATAAQSSQTAAATSESNAAGSASNAAVSASQASTSATNAAASASAAGTSETNAASAETGAVAAQSAAEAARDAALAAAPDWLSGAGVPAGGLGDVGDWYINETNGDVYEKTGASVWTLRTNIQGPQGIQGIQGPQGDQGVQGIQGPAGADGAEWFTGTGAPSGALGVVGDFYLETAAGDYYEKTGASTWTVRGNLQGPAGPGSGDMLKTENLSGLANYATARVNMGLAIGTDVQAFETGLNAISGLAKTDSNFIVGNGTTWVAESGATVRASLGLGTMATEAAASYQALSGKNAADGYAGLDANSRVASAQTPEVVQDYGIKRAAPSSSAGTLTLDYSAGPDFEVTLSENVATIAVANWPPASNLGKLTLCLKQPTSGAHTVAFTGFDFGDVGAPTMPTGTGAVLEVGLWSRDGGTTKRGSKYFEKAGA